MTLSTYEYRPENGVLNCYRTVHTLEVNESGTIDHTKSEESLVGPVGCVEVSSDGE